MCLFSVSDFYDTQVQSRVNSDSRHNLTSLKYSFSFFFDNVQTSFLTHDKDYFDGGILFYLECKSVKIVMIDGEVDSVEKILSLRILLINYDITKLISRKETF